MKVKDLKNHFLVAMPSITDPIFKQSLILICDDNKDGTMGLIINKPINNDNLLFMQNDDYISLEQSKVYFGGPVNMDVGFVLHESDYHTDQTLNISKTILLSFVFQTMQLTAWTNSISVNERIALLHIINIQGPYIK